MYDCLKRLWDTKRLDEAGLCRAVAKQWITPEQFFDISGIKYEVANAE